MGGFIFWQMFLLQCFQSRRRISLDSLIILDNHRIIIISSILVPSITGCKRIILLEVTEVVKVIAYSNTFTTTHLCKWTDIIPNSLPIGSTDSIVRYHGTVDIELIAREEQESAWSSIVECWSCLRSWIICRKETSLGNNRTQYLFHTPVNIDISTNSIGIFQGNDSFWMIPWNSCCNNICVNIDISPDNDEWFYRVSHSIKESVDSLIVIAYMHRVWSRVGKYDSILINIRICDRKVCIHLIIWEISEENSHIFSDSIDNWIHHLWLYRDVFDAIGGIKDYITSCLPDDFYFTDESTACILDKCPEHVNPSNPIIPGISRKSSCSWLPEHFPFFTKINPTSIIAPGPSRKIVWINWCRIAPRLSKRNIFETCPSNCSYPEIPRKSMASFMAYKRGSWVCSWICWGFIKFNNSWISIVGSKYSHSMGWSSYSF